MDVMHDYRTYPPDAVPIKFQIVMEELHGIWRSGKFNIVEDVVIDDDGTTFCASAELVRWEFKDKDKRDREAEPVKLPETRNATWRNFEPHEFQYMESYIRQFELGDKPIAVENVKVTKLLLYRFAKAIIKLQQ